MKKIRFIANPLSGTNRNRNLSSLIEKYLDHKQYQYDFCQTEYAGHAVELARKAVEEGCFMTVACGGDGSVNEIAGQLIDTDTILGVLPCGSGNGFAMHLGIGRNVAKAFEYLNEGVPLSIDTCRMNGRPFVNLSGTGFDAVVAKRLRGSRVRGFWGYFRSTLEEVRGYKMQTFDVEIDGQQLRREALLVEVANAPVYGYGFSIIPPAKLNDGLMEVLIANKAPKWRYLLESWRFVNHSFHHSTLVECYKGKKVTVKPARPTAVHLDGEGFDLDGPAEYTIHPASLKVMCPKVFAEVIKKSQLIEG